MSTLWTRIEDEIHLALIAVYENRMVAPIKNRYKSSADHIFGYVVEGFLRISVSP